MAKFYKHPKPVVLVVMDGVGVAPPGPGNAVMLADTPTLDKLWPEYPHAYLQAAGRNVGLPDGADGNSEVGHMTLGTGKVLFQDLPRIENKIKSGEFVKNEELNKAIEFSKKKGGAIHVIGLLGDGLVHSSKKHLYKLIELIADNDVDPNKVFIHPFLDGRDSSPTAGAGLMKELGDELERKRIGRIASFIGRYYAMDRDERWDRTKLAYDLITKGIGKEVTDIQKALKDSYKKSETDEYMKAYVVPDHEGKKHEVKNGDAIIMFNFRPDRAIQITKAFEDKAFKGFERDFLDDIYYVGFTDYKQGFPTHIAFPQDKVTDSLGKTLSENGLKQLRIAESEKFPHVTYFFDGGKKIVFPGEEQIEVPSPKEVATYDEAPEMSTAKIVKNFKEKVDEDKFDFILVNIAAPDMVAHTGVLDAAITAMEAADTAVGEIVEYVLGKDGVVLLTADHGNCEELVNIRTGEVDTKHSTNHVPFVAVQKGQEPRELQLGILADVAPTILYLFGIDKPAEMTGRNLLV